MIELEEPALLERTPTHRYSRGIRPERESRGNRGSKLLGHPGSRTGDRFDNRFSFVGEQHRFSGVLQIGPECRYTLWVRRGLQCDDKIWPKNDTTLLWVDRHVGEQIRRKINRDSGQLKVACAGVKCLPSARL